MGQSRKTTSEVLGQFGLGDLFANPQREYGEPDYTTLPDLSRQERILEAAERGISMHTHLVVDQFLEPGITTIILSAQPDPYQGLEALYPEGAFFDSYPVSLYLSYMDRHGVVKKEVSIEPFRSQALTFARHQPQDEVEVIPAVIGVDIEAVPEAVTVEIWAFLQTCSQERSEILADSVFVPLRKSGSTFLR